MAEYEILFKESVWKDLKKIPKNDLKRILSRIEKIGDDPRSMGCEKLTGEELYRDRQGIYRIVFSILTIRPSAMATLVCFVKKGEIVII